MSDTEKDTVKPADTSSSKRTRVRRVRSAPSPASGGDAALVDRILSGDWRGVLQEVGSTEYNRLRLVALKKK